MPFEGQSIHLTDTQRDDLEEIARSNALPAGFVRRAKIHVILDNLSTHKTKLVEAFLDEHPNVTLHFTPTYSSRLNQVGQWFSKVQRDDSHAAHHPWKT